MITKLKSIIIAISLFLVQTAIIAQTPPPLGTAADFVLFTSVGAVTNVGASQITGDFGSNAGAVTGFGSVNGNMHVADAVTAQCAADVTAAYNNINAQTPGTTLGVVLGSGQVLLPNVYMIPAAGSQVGILTLDGGGNPDACFVFQINGAFSAAASSSIILTNGTKACNVFWRIDGANDLGANSYWKGTMIVAGATTVAAGCQIDGRVLAFSGAISVEITTIGTPIGCGSPVLTGPAAPNLNTVECFAMLNSSGTVANTGTTNVVGDIGTNSGTVSGYNSVSVAGVIHSFPDSYTAQGSADLASLYTYLNGLPSDIELLTPALFGYSQVLTPHVYIMNAAVVLTDTIFLDARSVAGAVFVIRIMGALTTGLSPQIVLVGGTEAKNVFWQVEGAVTISSGNFSGIIVANNGAIVLNAGVILKGKALSTNGNITTQNANITGPSCVIPLPIVLRSFSAVSKETHIQLNWTTTTETKNEYFNIERSADAINFTSISKIKGEGNSKKTLNYSTVDDDPLEETSYYRLKQTNYDGKTSYSSVEAVEFKKQIDFVFNIYPNPNDGDGLYLQISKNDNARLIMVVNDMLGKEMYSKIIVTNKNSKEVYIDSSQKLNTGVYLITVASGNKIYKKRLTVINNQ